MKDVLFSFVILSFNSEKYIQKCLTSINDAMGQLKLNAEVFVVDNGSVDQSRTILNAFKFNQQVSLNQILFDTNTGTTFSRNAALKKSTGQYVVILDSDAYVNATVLVELKNYLETHESCGLVVPKLTYPDGRYQLSVDQFPTLVHKIKRYLFLKKLEAQKPDNMAGDVDYAISAFWMLPQKILSEVGLLDEKIFYSPEDVDYCIRIWKAGYKITYLPEYSAIHDAQEISRPKGFKLLNLFSLSHIKGLAYLYRKHRFLFSGKKFIH